MLHINKIRALVNKIEDNMYNREKLTKPQFGLLEKLKFISRYQEKLMGEKKTRVTNIKKKKEGFNI